MSLQVGDTMIKRSIGVTHSSTNLFLKDLDDNEDLITLEDVPEGEGLEEDYDLDTYDDHLNALMEEATDPITGEIDLDQVMVILVSIDSAVKVNLEHLLKIWWINTDTGLMHQPSCTHQEL